MIGSLLFYLILIFICSLLISISHKNKNKNGIYAAYFTLVLISVFRYDIGNDYQNYYYMIRNLANGFHFNNNAPLFSIGSIEPLFYFLSALFKNATYPTFWVLAIYFIISLFFLYKAFEENKSHFVGIFIFFISGMLFVYWDQVRQGLAISIIIYAIKFIKEDKFSKYFLFILLAASAHYSALLILPFYFVNKIRPIKFIYIVIILALSISNFATNYFIYLFDNTVALIPYFDTRNTSQAYTQILSSGYKFRIFYYSLLWCTIIFFLPKKERVLTNFLFIGAIIFIVASGALNIMRFSFYFIFTIALSIPIILKIKKAKIITMIMVFGLFLFFIRDVYTNTNTRGCTPYKTIISNDFNMERFRKRK